MNSHFRNLYWGVRDCDKCRDGEDIYFCKDCGRFYCSHCLIYYNGKLVCPSGRNHELIDVVEFGEGLGKRMIEKIGILAKKLDVVMNLLELFSEMGDLVNDMIERKIYVDRELFQKTFEKVSELRDSLNSINDTVREAREEFKNNINLAFKLFGEGNLEGALESIDDNNINTIITIFDSRDLEDFVNALKRDITNSINMYELVKDMISNIDKDEWFVSASISKTSKKPHIVILTDRKLMFSKNGSLVANISLDNIVSIDQKESLRFKGLVLKHTDGQIKIPCEGFDCYKIRVNVEQAQKIKNAAKVDKEALDDLTTTIDELKFIVSNIKESFNALRTEVLEITKKSLNRFLTRFYYTNGGSNYTRGILDLAKNRARRDRTSALMMESNLNKPQVADYPVSRGKRTSQKLIFSLYNRLNSLKSEVESKLNSGSLDPDIVRIYYELKKIIGILEGEMEGEGV